MDYEDDFSWQDDPNMDIAAHQDLLIIRHLIENGYLPAHFEGAAPPASKAEVERLEERKVKIDRTNPEKSAEKCVICLKLDPADPDDDDDDDVAKSNQTDKDGSYEKIFKVMPCSHAFHRLVIAYSFCKHHWDSNHLFELQNFVNRIRIFAAPFLLNLNTLMCIANDVIQTVCIDLKLVFFIFLYSECILPW